MEYILCAFLANVLSMNFHVDKKKSNAENVSQGNEGKLSYWKKTEAFD